MRQRSRGVLRKPSRRWDSQPLNHPASSAGAKTIGAPAKKPGISRRTFPTNNRGESNLAKSAENHDMNREASDAKSGRALRRKRQ
jgi:hypothetical protein